MKDKLIVIEGACDGIGKSTQFCMLRSYLEKNNEVISHHFPSYGTKEGSLVEDYLRGFYGKPEELSPYFVNSLYAEDRIITWLSKLKKEYDDGKIVLLDRYTTSSLIYQSALFEDIDEKKAFIDYVIDYEYSKLALKVPDKVIFLNAPFDLIAKMRNDRKDNEGIKKDIHEENNDFMKKVYDNSQFVASYLGWVVIDCDDNGKMKTPEEIHQMIIDSLE